MLIPCLVILAGWGPGQHAPELLGLDEVRRGTIGARTPVVRTDLLAAFDHEEAQERNQEGLCVLAAATLRGAAEESNENGIFTRALLEGLRGAADRQYGGNRDGYVYVQELVNYVFARVPRLSKAGQTPSVPLQVGENFPLTREK